MPSAIDYPSSPRRAESDSLSLSLSQDISVYVWIPSVLSPGTLSFPSSHACHLPSKLCSIPRTLASTVNVSVPSTSSPRTPLSFPGSALSSTGMPPPLPIPHQHKCEGQEKRRCPQVCLQHHTHTNTRTCTRTRTRTRTQHTLSDRQTLDGVNYQGGPLRGRPLYQQRCCRHRHRP